MLTDLSAASILATRGGLTSLRNGGRDCRACQRPPWHVTIKHILKRGSSVPTYDRFIEPVLRFLATHSDGATARDVHDAAALSLGFTDADRSELLPSGVQTVYKNRAGWAHDRLKRSGLSTSPKRGFWRLSDAGREFARVNPTPLSETMVERLATENHDVRLRPIDQPQAVLVAVAPSQATASPDDRLEAALSELRQTVAAELLEMLSQVSPQYFETIVLDVLHRMGYGASREDLRRVGGVGDGGIDGVISLDRLGLEKVYVQAKRWQGSVGRPEVQAFYGALAGQRATKGVFITTSTFSQQAIDFVRSVERVVLVDGEKLAGLMMEHEVGVTLRPLKIPKLDSDYFDDRAFHSSPLALPYDRITVDTRDKRYDQKGRPGCSSV